MSTKESISIKNLVIKICELCNKNFENVVNISKDRLGKDMTYLLDSEAIRNEFGWRDTINLDEGIKETIEWVKNNFEVLSKLSWKYEHKL